VALRGPRLAQTHTVIAPDLPGHGESDAPLGDYSPGAQASALRDVILGLGLDGVSLVGHSLGGGTVMQFAYQFPERTERLALISSGGLGTEVTPLLRAATLPGAEAVLSGLALLPRRVSRPAVRVLAFGPELVSKEDSAPIADALVTMGSERHRHTFVRTARTVLDLHGQVLSATGTFAALSDMPVLIAWGANDQTIPPEHHRTLARRLPKAVTCEIPRAGHYPQETSPIQLTDALISFLASSAPYEYDEDRWRSLSVLGVPADRSC
jgi:pimeloyl-ACP methyl ester carboxylesterase